jgi:hypothetical protein
LAPPSDQASDQPAGIERRAAADQPPRELSLVQRMADLAIDKIAFFDRKRRVRRCSAYDGQLSYPSVQRAPVEAFALQLSELCALSTIDRSGLAK